MAFGADEQYAAAAGNRVGHDLERLMQQRNRLRQVDDVHVVTLAENVTVHFRVPAVGIVAEVGASFQ